MKSVIAAGIGLLLLAVAAPVSRAAAAADITGKWQFVLNTEGGDRTAAATFQVDGNKVSGKWGDANADVAGTFTDGALDLAFPYNSDEAGPGTLKLKGKLEGDALTGTWEFQEYSGTFKATRPPQS